MKTLLLIWSLAIGHCLAAPFFFGQQGVVATSSTTPSDYTNNMVAEWIADNISGSDGAAVTTWPDLQGGYDFTQSTAAAKPTLQTAEVNGHNAVQADGVDDAMLSTLVPTYGDFTIFGVWKASGGGTYPRIICTTYATGFWMGRSSSGTGGWGAGCIQASSPYMTQVSTSVTTGTWYVMSARRSGTSWTVRVNGAAYTASGTVSSTALSATAVGVFKEGSDSGSVFNGMASHFRVYNDDLSDANRLLVEQRLGTLYGISITP